MMVLDTVCNDMTHFPAFQYVIIPVFRDENSMTTGGKGMEDGSLDTSKTE